MAQEILEFVKINMLKISISALAVPLTLETKLRDFNFKEVDKKALRDALNAHYNIAISADDAKAWQTVADIVDMVERKTR